MAMPVGRHFYQGDLIGASTAMQEVFHLIERVAPTDATVLLTGESGTGKELAARGIHEASPRHEHAFITVNCGATPTGLIEAELFGVESPHQAGVFERANGGTVFLDEITELPMDMQIRVLRALESKKFYRVGASTEFDCNVRIIAATSRCPVTAVKNGQLREDLLYRLAAFPIAMPPLKNRGDDVELLAEQFLSALNERNRTDKRLSALSRMKLRQHSWPGNVRELRNCIERAYIMADASLELAPLIQNTRDDASFGGRLEIRIGSRIHDMERSLIEATLDHFKGNKRRAADALGCSLKTLYNKLNGYSQRQEVANS
jgi:DNA-binding NtrC family response regulator